MSIESINMFENCLKWVIYINTLQFLVSLGENKKLLEIFTNLSNDRGPEVNL